MLLRLGPLVRLLSAILLCLATDPLAAAPWSRLFKRVDTDPNKDYKLTAEQGPWMIMAASFSGEGAVAQAHELVMELRTRFRAEAYAYDKVFDFRAGAEGEKLDRFGQMQKKQYKRGGTYKEIAVLVGNFAEIDDPEGQKLLKELKYASISCLEFKEGKKDNRNLAYLRELQKEVSRMAGGEAAQKAEKGPLGHAFITANPLLPDDYFNPNKLDPFVVRLNTPVQYSLLKCPGKYTVKIATFTGGVVIDPKKIREIEATNKVTSRLEIAFEKAHTITEELRKRGVEAYEFHDRNMSMVTVGSFHQLGTQRPDGKVDLAPQILAVLKEYGAEIQATPGQAARVGEPKAIARIPLDVQPQLVEVPRDRQVTEADRAKWRSLLPPTK